MYKHSFLMHKLFQLIRKLFIIFFVIEHEIFFVFIYIFFLVKMMILKVLYFLLQILNIWFQLFFVFIFKFCQAENLIISFQLAKHDLFRNFLNDNFLLFFLLLNFLFLLENLFGNLFFVKTFQIKHNKASNQKNQHRN